MTRLEAPLKLTVCLTARCNLGCRHCYADCGTEEELDTFAWTKIVRDALEAGVISFFVEGGEPLLRADLFELLREMTPYALTRVRTNATLVTPEVAHELAAAGVAGVYVDFMGADPATHDASVGSAGAQRRTLAGVQALREACLPVTGLIILTRENMGEVQAFLELAAAHDMHEVGLLRLYPIGRARRRWHELAPSLAEQMAVVQTLRPPPGVGLMHSWHPRDGNCCWQMAAVSPHGRSIGCAYLREFVDYGDLVSGSLLSSWDHPLYRQLRAGDSEQSCGSCSLGEGTSGGCRSTAYAFHGRWSAPDPFDEPINNGVDLRELPAWMRGPGPRRAPASGT